jgi:hypothetical protein
MKFKYEQIQLIKNYTDWTLVKYAHEESFNMLVYSFNFTCCLRI